MLLNTISQKSMFTFINVPASISYGTENASVRSTRASERYTNMLAVNNVKKKIFDIVYLSC